MDEPIEQEDFLNDVKEFLELNKRKIRKNFRDGSKALIIDFDDLLGHSPKIAENLIELPEETIQLFEVAAEETTWLPDDVRARLSSISKSQEIKIRHIRAKYIGKMISIDGIIRRASEIRPMTTNIKFECPSCGTIISVLQLKKEQSVPKRCSCGRKAGFKEIAKDMIDAQIIVVEEAQDSIDDGGSQPKRLNVLLKEDLTDISMNKMVIPGNRIKIIGTLETVEMGNNSKKPLTRFDLIIGANNLIPLEEDIDDIQITEEEEREIIEISKKPDLLDYLSKSVAPSVYGNEDIKKALTFQLFGGASQRRSDGSMSREQIHGLLVGDPGVAKSVILKYLKELSNKSRYVSGKGASGVGLTATATMDDLTKTWALEAGAMVLANNGSLFIDEFEKMSEEDRSNLHEGMSVGTISVSKASIQATLNAKTSILAAANPKFGRFDIDKTFASQINLAPSLLSRFDFIFVMRDVPEEIRDTAIANKIFDEHMEGNEEDFLEKNMYRKYVAYAKSFKPKLSQASIGVLKKYYINLRNRAKKIEGKQVIPIGARQLEGLIRLSEAHSKMRLSNLVTIGDAESAIEIMEAYLKEVGYDKENNTFDIDKISGNSASQRGKMDIIRDAITELGGSYNGNVPIDEVCKLLDTKFTSKEVSDIINKIVNHGDGFKPKKGCIHLM